MVLILYRLMPINIKGFYAKQRFQRVSRSKYQGFEVVFKTEHLETIFQAVITMSLYFQSFSEVFTYTCQHFSKGFMGNALFFG